MYTGPRFTRDQLIVVVGAIFRGATDQIQSSLPPLIPHDEAAESEKEIQHFVHGVVNTVGIQLPILYASITGDGMGAGDFGQFDQFETMAENYLLSQLAGRGDPTAGTFHNTDELVAGFVDEFFSDYLAG